MFFAVLGVYYVFNVSLELFFGIVVYPTKVSSGFTLTYFIAVATLFSLMYIFGLAVCSLKKRQQRSEC